MQRKVNKLEEVKKLLADQNKEQTEFKSALNDILMLLQQVGSNSIKVATTSSSVRTPEVDDDATTRQICTLESSYPTVHAEFTDDNEVDD